MTRLSDEESDKLYMSDPKAKSIGAFIEALTILVRYVEGGVEKRHFSAAVLRGRRWSGGGQR